MDLDLASADGKGEGRVLYVGVNGPVYDPSVEVQGVVVSDEGNVLP